MTVATGLPTRISIAAASVVAGTPIVVLWNVTDQTELEVVYNGNVIATLGTHYTVTLKPATDHVTADVTPTAALVALLDSVNPLVIRPDMNLTQQWNASALLNLPPVGLEGALDRPALYGLQLQEQIDRSMRFALLPGGGSELPPYIVGGGTYLTFNGTTLAWGTAPGTLAQPNFATVAEAVAATIPAAVTQFHVAGYTLVGKGPALYTRAVSEPSHDFKLQTADTAWWEGQPTNGYVTPEMFGTTSDDVTNDTAAFVKFLNYLDQVGERANGLITYAHQLDAWASFQIDNALRIEAFGKGKLTFTSPVGTEVFKVHATTASRIEIEGLEMVGATGLDLFDMLPLTGTMVKFRLENNRISGFDSLFFSNTSGTIEEVFLVSNRMSGCTNGFKIDLLLGHVQIFGNEIKDFINSTDEITYGFRIGKDGIPGWTSQTSSSFFHVHHNKIDRLENTAGTQTANVTNAILCYGEDIVVEGNTLQDVISTRTTDVEGIYTQARRSIIRGNVLKNAGTEQGSITLKGEPPGAGLNADPIGDWSLCEGNLIDVTTGSGIYFAASNVTIQNNIIRNTTKRAIWGQHNTEGLGRVVITGNRMQNCDEGIEVEGQTTSLVIANNTTENSVLPSGDNAGISIDLASAHAVSGLIVIRDNTMDGVTATIGHSRGVVFVAGTFSAAQIDIVGNTLNGVAASLTKKPILFAGNGLPPPIVNIVNNWADAIYSEINNGKALFSSLTFENNHCAWSEAVDITRDLVTIFMSDHRIMHATAEVIANDGAAPPKYAQFTLEAVRTKDDGILTLSGSDTDAEVLSDAQAWDASIAAQLDATGTDIVVTGTDIAFANPSTITASTTDLSVFEVGEKIRGSGTVSNNIDLTIATVSATTITTVETTITTEGSGSSFTLTKIHEGLSLRVRSNDATPTIAWRAKLNVAA